MKKKSRLAVLLAAVLACAMLFTGVAFATAATELNANREDIEAALSAEEVQAELAYQQLLSCTTVQDMYAALFEGENALFPVLYFMNQEQLNGAYSHAQALYDALENPTADDEDYRRDVCDSFLIVAVKNGIMLLGQGEAAGTMTAAQFLERASNGKIMLTDNVTIIQGPVVVTGTLTIDLNGCVLSANGASRVLQVSANASLTIEDSNPDKSNKGTRRNITEDEIRSTKSSWETNRWYNIGSKNPYDSNKEYFWVADGTGSNSITGGVITGGKAAGSDNIGGGIWVQGTLYFNGGTIAGCYAFNGGGIGIETTGKVIIDGGTLVYNNAANAGAAVYNRGTLTMQSGEMHHNASGVMAHGSGGGVYMAANNTAKFIMNGGSINNNRGVSGGGVLVDGAAGSFSWFIMNGGTISNNVAAGGENPSYGNGAAIYSQFSFVTLNGGTITGNHARRYGGAVNLHQGATLNITGTSNLEITNNTALYGGALSQESGNCSLTIENPNVVISKNTAYHCGGAIMIDYGSLTIKAGEISFNKTLGTSPTEYGYDTENVGKYNDYVVKSDWGSGGAICLYTTSGDTTFTMTGGTIKNNTAVGSGGGLFSTSTPRTDASQTETVKRDMLVKLHGGTFDNNSANDIGGAIYVYKSENNTGTAKIIMSKEQSSAQLTVKNNKAQNGGAFAISSGSIEMSYGTVSGNSATSNGGAVYVTGGNFTMKGGTITTNTSDNDGGAVYMAGGEFTMENGSVNGNTATKNGGAVYMTTGNFTMHHGAVDNNSANNGGAVYMAGTTAQFKMESGSMSSNHAIEKVEGDGTGDGGAIYAVGGVLKIGLEGCVGSTTNEKGEITGDNAEAHLNEHGCGISCTHPKMENNTASDCGGAIAISKSGDTAGTVYFYCGNAIGNKALYKGVGMNVFMDGGDFYYYNGANVGVPRDPDLVIVGGKLHNETTGEEKLVNLYYYVSNDNTKEDMVGLAAEGEYINLPDAQYFWANEKPEGKRFFGWTAKGSASGNAAKNVRNKSDYVPSGTAVQVIDREDVGVGQGTWDGDATDNIIHLYALWAPETSNITYVERVWDYLDTAANEPEVVTTYAPKTYSIRETETVVNITAPEKPGYQLTGWYIYQDEGQDANWGYEPAYIENATGRTYGELDFDQIQSLNVTDDGLALKVDPLTFGNITLIAEWEELTADITYQVVGPNNQEDIGGYFGETDGTRVTKVTETIGQATGTPAGATAIADSPNYKFVDWYTNAACTTEADSTWITDKMLVPQKTKLDPTDETETALYRTATYYALFDFDVADLTIIKSGLAEGDSAIIKVTGYNTASDEEQTWYITLTGENAKAVIKNMKINTKYTITEMDNWSVYYTTTDVDLVGEKTVNQFVNGVNSENTVEITNTPKADKWLHDESAKVNKPSTGN